MFQPNLFKYIPTYINIMGHMEQIPHRKLYIVLYINKKLYMVGCHIWCLNNGDGSTTSTS